jgi:hypothetical protein
LNVDFPVQLGDELGAVGCGQDEACLGYGGPAQPSTTLGQWYRRLQSPRGRDRCGDDGP